MIKLVAFDWNGTLLSDTNAALIAENMVMKSSGTKPITLLKFQQSFDIPIIKFWLAVGLTEKELKKNIVSIEDTFHNNYEKLVNSARTRSGTKEVLEWLHQKHILRIIYSNHNLPNIHRQLTRLKINHFIDTVLARKNQSDQSHVFGRTKEQKLFGFVKQNKLKPREVVSVGDTEEEIQIGKQYGYHTVAITGGYNTTARLKKQKPDFLIHNMLELKKIVKQLNKY